MKTMITLINKKGENAIPNALQVLEQMKDAKKASFGIATAGRNICGKDFAKLSTNKLCSPIALGFASTAPTQSQPYLTTLKDGLLLFDGRIYTPTQTKENTKKQFDQTNQTKAAENIVQNSEGEFYLVSAQADVLVAARDPVGVQPLYFGENTTIAALASDRKSLWKIGLEPKCFPPGQVATVTAQGFKFTNAKTLKMQPPKPWSMGQAADTLQNLLTESIQKRVADQKEVAVAFSGGLDSSVVACLAQKCGVEVELVHVSLENQPESDAAFEAAAALDLPMQVHLYKESDVERTVVKVVELIEEPDPVKASIGVPFFWTAQRTAEADYRVLLAGQGADELFGGYQRYVNQYISEGDQKVRETMFNDVATIHETNVERDEKLCIFNDVELRLPFGTYPVAEFAMNLPTQLKFEAKPDTLRKLVLRKVAQNLGLPPQIADKPKKAVQYSTGISTCLKKIAKRHNQTLKQYIQQMLDESRN